MTDTLNIVYQAIKELSVQHIANSITKTTLASHLGLSEDEVLLAIRELHKANKVRIDDVLLSTGRDDYDEILEFVSITAI